MAQLGFRLVAGYVAWCRGTLFKHHPGQLYGLGNAKQPERGDIRVVDRWRYHSAVSTPPPGEPGGACDAGSPARSRRRLYTVRHQ
jgi:hypothetical protein